MPTRSIRITCPGATAAAVAATLLIGAGARFSAAPLGDGRWLIEAEVADTTASLLALRIGEPLVLEVVEDVAPAVEERAPAPPDNGVLDVTSFRAKTLAVAKTTAARMARGFGATVYGDGRWMKDGGVFLRPAYRGKQTGAVVFGAHEDEGRWWCGWRPAT